MTETPRSIIRKLKIHSTKKLSHEFTGLYKSTFKGQGILFDAVREYQPGDEVRYIDWNVSARTNHLFVKEFIEERERHVVIACDMSGSMDFGIKDSKKQVLLQLAMIIMQSAAGAGDRISLLMFTDKVEEYREARKGSKSVMRMLNDIMQFVPKGRATDIGLACDFMQKVLRKRSIVFLISDFLGADYAGKMKVLSRRHDIIPVRIVDRAEVENKLFGLIDYTDLETGERIVSDLPPKTGSIAFEGFDPIVIQTEDPVFETILRYMKRRAKRRTRRW